MLLIVMTRAIAVLSALAAGTGLLFAGSIVPAGTLIEVRLTTEASSEKPSGQAVTGVVIAPVFVNESMLIPAGTRLTGTTADASPDKPATAQTAESPATLRIQFNRIEDRHGRSKSIECVLAELDNARETLSAAGLITGIGAEQSYEGLLDQGLGKIPGEFGTLLTGLKTSLLKQVDPSIDFKPGVEFKIKLTKDLDWNASAAIGVAAITPVQDLAGLVQALPFRTLAQKPAKPSDLVNLMFLGTEEQVRQAFKDAGWFTAAELSAYSKMETARAIIENRGYSEAPMSVLYLDGKPPDMTFQKQNDTFDKRHHIRLWMQPQRFHGQPVWEAAATHDTGITFSQVSRNFTHGIDPNIDAERSKVVNDLLFTGRVRAIALVDRPQVPADLSNATGDKLVSDHRLAVLQF